MAAVNDKALREMNSEYRNICRKYSKFSKIETLLRTMRKGIFLETISLKLNKAKYFDKFYKKCNVLDENKCISKNTKIVVYMCVVGKYDSIYEPIVLMDNTDYFIITDLDIPKDSVWKKIAIDKSKFQGKSNVEINRYYKLHPHEVFKDCEYSIYIDGNIRIVEDISYIIANMRDSNLIYGVFRHPDRDCIYTEFNYVMRLKRFVNEREKYKKQIADYIKDGFPKHFGLYENTILIRKHDEEKVIKLMDAWWNELMLHSFRDQLSFPYVMWKEGWSERDICVLGYDLKDCNWERYYLHK